MGDIKGLVEIFIMKIIKPLLTQCSLLHHGKEKYKTIDTQERPANEF